MATRPPMSAAPLRGTSFSDVSCRQSPPGPPPPARSLPPVTASVAQVRCTFDEHGDDPGSPTASSWTIELSRTRTGPWLIYDYGEG
jgi:hypothetical protein